MSGPRNRGNERFYSPPAVRRHQHQLMMQRERDMMFLQWQQFQQQQQQQLHLMMMMRQFEEQQRLIQQQQLNHQHQQERRNEVVVESTFTLNSSMIQTNIDRLVETVMPVVPARHFLEPRRNGREAHGAGLIQFFNLDDLWESYREWSAYGAGVDLKLNGNEGVTQYYAPSLSIIQLYVGPAAARPGIDTISQRMSQMGIAPSSNTGESSHSRGNLIFEYQEREPPHQRKPLYDKISALAIGFSDLKKYRSCDLLPSSWLSVAWYPIYRIPMGPSLKTLEASFLTFHHLSTSGMSVVGASKSAEVALPVFGLASYKFRSPILPLLDSEQRLSNSLFESAKKLDRAPPGLPTRLQLFSEERKLI